MKNISVSVDEDTHRRLRSMAAEQGTSVSAIIRKHIPIILNGWAHADTGETEPEWRRRRLTEVLEEFQRKGIGISMKDNQTREEMYQRNASR